MKEENMRTRITSSRITRGKSESEQSETRSKSYAFMPRVLQWMRGLKRRDKVQEKSAKDYKADLRTLGHQPSIKELIESVEKSIIQTRASLEYLKLKEEESGRNTYIGMVTRWEAAKRLNEECLRLEAVASLAYAFKKSRWSKKNLRPELAKLNALLFEAENTIKEVWLRMGSLRAVR